MIEHEGIVDRIEDGKVQVKINSMSACAACHAKGVCTAADQEEKILDVNIGSGDYNIGDHVMVQVQKRLGLRAVGLAYFYPFLLLMAALVIMLAAGVPELRAGALSLLVLPPWYLGLYLLRNKMESTFTFSLKKQG